MNDNRFELNNETHDFDFNFFKFTFTSKYILSIWKYFNSDDVNV